MLSLTAGRLAGVVIAAPALQTVATVRSSLGGSATRTVTVKQADFGGLGTIGANIGRIVSDVQARRAWISFRGKQ